MILIVFGNLTANAQDEAQTAFREGVKFLKSKEFTEAEKMFSIAIDKGQNQEILKMSYIYKGFSLNGQQKYDQAKNNLMDIKGSIEDYTLAIKYKPDYMEAFANRGVQKNNAVPVKEKIGKNIDCLEDPCSDLLKAKELGDTTVDDMIYLYCKKCK